jgi:uncharacterized protein (TIGR00645 family)
MSHDEAEYKGLEKAANEHFDKLDEKKNATKNSGPIRWLEKGLFNTRWMLIPFYIGLAIVLFFYGVAYFHELLMFIRSYTASTSIDEIKLFALDAIDIVMVGNLIKMIITGSYNSFVSKNHGYTGENISSGELKIKITTSIIVLCSVHLLTAFIGTEESWMQIEKQLIIFGAFVISALVLSIIEYIHNRS